MRKLMMKYRRNIIHYNVYANSYKYSFFSSVIELINVTLTVYPRYNM